MRILALESSLFEGSVAALDSGKVLRETKLDPALRTARSFAPGMRQMLREVGWKPADVQLITVATGPGSFTGLRVACTAAKVFAYAVKAEVIAVDTLEVIAAQVPPGHPALIMAVMDAQREELFLKSFRRAADGQLADKSELRIVGNDAWLADLAQDPSSLITGPGLHKLVERIPAGVQVAPSENWAPMAATVGQLGWRAYQSGRRDDVFGLLPDYGRPSAAEEKKAKK